MKRLLFSSLLLLLAAACPKVERKVYTFDIKAGTGEVRYLNIVTDSPEKSNDDFLEVLNKMILGTQIETENPGWRVTSKELYVENGQLNGLVKFEFASPERAGIYKHDKKAPYFWCTGDTIVTTNGDRVPTTEKCVVWGSKMKKLEVTVTEGEISAGDATLLPVYERWKAGETIEASAGGDAFGSGGLGSGFESALGGLTGGLMEAMTAGLGLSGTTTLGDIAVEGPLAPAAIKTKIDAFGGTSALNVCYATFLAENSGAKGDSKLRFKVDPAGAASDFELTGDLTDPTVASCLTDMVQAATYPSASAGSVVTIPLSFAP